MHLRIVRATKRKRTLNEYNDIVNPQHEKYVLKYRSFLQKRSSLVKKTSRKAVQVKGVRNSLISSLYFGTHNKQAALLLREPQYRFSKRSPLL